METTETTRLAEATFGMLRQIVKPNSDSTMSQRNGKAPPWSQDASWRALNIGLNEGHHPKVERLAVTAEWFSKSCLRNDRTHGAWAVIAGNTGCGKTHASLKIAQYVAERQIDAWHKGWLGSITHLGSPAFLQMGTTI